MLVRFSDLVRFDEVNLHKPGWANFLFALGRSFASSESTNTTAIIVIPTVDLAAPVIALGYIFERYCGNKIEEINIDIFRRLPAGTSVIYKSDDGPQRAVFECITRMHDVDWVVIKVEWKSKSKQFVHPDQLYRIELLPEDEVQFEEEEIGRSVEGVSGFEKAVFGKENVGDSFTNHNSTWVIGNLSEIEEEIDGNIHLQAVKNEDESGTFRELLRAVHCNRRSDNSFVRLMSNYIQDGVGAPLEDAKFAIFRGGASYLRQRQHYPNATQIILTSPSDRELEQVIATYNQEYYKRATEWQADLQIPSNINISGFLRK